jgi:hypothetical protein
MFKMKRFKEEKKTSWSKVTTQGSEEKKTSWNKVTTQGNEEKKRWDN